MLEFDGINFWAVAVVWLINIAIGAFWYSPTGFGKSWTRYTGIDHMKIPEKEATKTIGYIAIAALIQAVVLAVIIQSLDITTAVNGILAGVVVWFGFTAATTVGNTLYSRLSWKLWWLNASYFLLVITIGAAILAIW